MRNLTAITAAIALATSYGSAPATAGGATTIAAASCERAPVLAFNVHGIVLNGSTATDGRLICSVLRDQVASKPLKIEVAVVDKSSVGDITCRVNAVNRFGTSVHSGAEVKTTGKSSAGQVLNLPIPSSLFINGTYVVTCVIPRKGSGDAFSFIGSILIDYP